MEFLKGLFFQMFVLQRTHVLRFLEQIFLFIFKMLYKNGRHNRLCQAFIYIYIYIYNQTRTRENKKLNSDNWLVGNFIETNLVCPFYLKGLGGCLARILTTIS
jgi:hypothetical protein